MSDDSVVFLHQDLTVTEAIWHDENVIFNRVTPLAPKGFEVMRTPVP